MTMTQEKRPARRTEYQITIPGLLSAIQEVKDVYQSLSSLPGIKLGESETAGIEKLKHFARQQAQVVANGGTVPAGDLHKTIRLAQNLRDGFDTHFEKFLEGSFNHFDSLCSKIRKLAPELLERDATMIAQEQDSLRRLLSTEAEYAEIAVAYATAKNHLEALVKEAEQAKETREEAAKKERAASAAKSVLDELDDF